MKYYTLVKYDLENNNKQLATLQEEINTAIANSLLLFFIIYGLSSSGKSHTTKLILQSIRDNLPNHTYVLKYYLVTKSIASGVVDHYDKIPVITLDNGINKHSSRAHCIINVLNTNLYIMDLCGNESANSLQIDKSSPLWNTMIDINTSLLALRKFINVILYNNSQVDKPKLVYPHRETVLNSILYKLNFHKSNLQAIGCFINSIDKLDNLKSEKLNLQFSADLNTLDFLKCIGLIVEPIVVEVIGDSLNQGMINNKRLSLKLEIDEIINKLNNLQKKLI
jgi:hypothetical protein